LESRLSIDMTKIDESRLYKGMKGTYLDLTTFVDTETKDKYENNGFITQSQTKEEREGGGERLPILGNVKVFFTDAVGMPTQGSPQKTQEVLDEDIPF
jgi:hypothetical protein